MRIPVKINQNYDPRTELLRQGGLEYTNHLTSLGYQQMLDYQKSRVDHKLQDSITIAPIESYFEQNRAMQQNIIVHSDDVLPDDIFFRIDNKTTMEKVNDKMSGFLLTDATIGRAVRRNVLDSDRMKNVQEQTTEEELDCLRTSLYSGVFTKPFGIIKEDDPECAMKRKAQEESRLIIKMEYGNKLSYEERDMVFDSLEYVRASLYK